MTVNLTKIVVNAPVPEFDIRYIVAKVPLPVKNLTFDKLKKSKFWHIENSNRSCFAAAGAMLHSFIKEPPNQPANIVLYKCLYDRCKQNNLVEDDRRKWIDLCKENKLLPEYINSKSLASTGDFLVVIDSIGMNRLYLYLSCIRYMQDVPTFCKAVLDLVEDGIGFFVAFLIATVLCIKHTNHHIIPQGCEYFVSAKENDILNTKVDLGEAVALHTFVNSTDKEMLDKISEIQRITLKSFIDSHKISGKIFTIKEAMKNAKKLEEMITQISDLQLNNM